MRFEPEDRLGGQALLSGRDDEFQATLRAHPFMRPVHWRLTEMRLEDVSDVILHTTEILRGFFLTHSYYSFENIASSNMEASGPHVRMV